MLVEPTTRNGCHTLLEQPFSMTAASSNSMQSTSNHVLHLLQDDSQLDGILTSFGSAPADDFRNLNSRPQPSSGSARRAPSPLQMSTTAARCTQSSS
eukprot:m.23510 g.23510  ORF g.23510 m.23510 type:complete len:97 (-) comp11394_c0_seq1:313-603(-)